MRSFGLWYKNEQDTKDESKFELHINLWNIKEKSMREEEPFIDFGLYVENFRSVNNISFLIPFTVREREVIDLFAKICDKDVARLIFNDSSCYTQSIPKAELYCLKIGTDDAGRLLFSLKDKEKGDWYKGVEFQNKEGYSILDIGLSDLKNSENYKEYNNLYVRFRIASESLKDLLFCDLEKRNYYLESGFSATQIIDLKINKERNIDRGVCETFISSKYKFAEFQKIHFLVMNPICTNFVTANP